MDERVRRRWTAAVSLTVGPVLILLGAWCFAEITESVVEGETLATRDTPVTEWLAANRLGWLTTGMLLLTHLGASWLTLPLVVLAGVLLPTHRSGAGPGRRRWRTVAFLVAATGGASLIVNVLKVVIARPRPELPEVVATATGYAFPSGHTAQAVAAYCALAYVVARGLSGWPVRAVVWTLAGTLGAVVGFSRLYLGVHWLTDVVGGTLVAMVWLALLVTAVRLVGEVRARRDGSRRPAGRA